MANHLQESAETPLLGPHYAFYNPKRAVVYAKKSRTNCCCVLFGVTSFLCCCLFFLISIGLGAFIAAYATECQNKTSSSLSYTAVATNLTFLSFVTSGDVIITRADSGSYNPNITITISRSAPSPEELNKFTSNFSVSNGSLHFTEQAPSSWKTILQRLCQSSSITIELPSVPLSSPEFVLQTSNAAVTMNLPSSVTFKSISITTSNGHIELDGVDAQSIGLTTSNGKLELGSISASSLHGATSNAKIESQKTITLKGRNCSLSLDTSNGKIDLETLVASPNSEIFLRTSNAQIETTVVSFAGGFAASTTNGNVKVDGKDIKYSRNDNDDKQGTFGSGYGYLNAATSNGNVDLTFN